MTLHSRILVLGWLIGVGTSVHGAERLAGPVRLEVNLTDGSRLMGETTVESLPFSPEGMAKIEVQLGFIGTISISKDSHVVNLIFRNGDKLRGAFVGKVAIRMKTLVGAVSVPLEAVWEIHVYPGGSG